MIFNKANIDDFHRYYDQVFLKIKLGEYFTGADLTPQWYHSIVKKASLVWSLTNVLSKEPYSIGIPILASSGLNVTYNMPAKQQVCFQEPSGHASVLFLYRKLDKQYKRGVGESNSYFKLTTASDGVVFLDISYDAIKLLAEAEQNKACLLSNSERWEALKVPKNRHCFTFSSCVNVSFTGAVSIYDDPVGMADFKRNIVHVNPLFYQEVRAALPPQVEVKFYVNKVARRT